MSDWKKYLADRAADRKRLKKPFVAFGYSGIDSREIGRANTRQEAEQIIVDFKADQVRRQGFVYWPMFWVHEET